MFLHSIPALQAARDALASDVVAIPEDAETVALLHDLAALREVKADLRLSEDLLVKAIGDRLTRRTTIVDGLGEVTRARNVTRRAWDHKALFRRVIAAARDERQVDPDTGEAEDPFEAAARVLAECITPSWKVGRHGKDDQPATGLRACGIDPDEYCQTEERGWTVTIKK